MDIIIGKSTRESIDEKISSQVKALILGGTLKEGDALPSMRMLALELRISVITTKRAYEELERDGFIESYTGKGSFVKAQNAELLREENLRQIEKTLGEVCSKARESGVSIDELTDILSIIYGGE